MFIININSCENVSGTDGTPSCFVKVFAEANGLNICIGKTRSSKKSTTPKWDRSLDNTFTIAFVYVDKLRFELLTKDFLGANDLVAIAAFQPSQMKLGGVKLKSYYSRTPNKPVYFNMKIEFSQYDFPFIKNTLSQQFYFYYLTFDPPIEVNPYTTQCYFHMNALDPNIKKPTLYNGSDARDGIYFNYQASFIGPTGLTQVCIIDPRALKRKMTYLPVLVNHGYRGRVSLNVAFSLRPNFSAQCLSIESIEHTKVYSKNAISLNVENDGVLPFGCVVNVENDVSYVSYDPIDLSLEGILSTGK